MKIQIKENKGITLVALVVTIVVLLILAGITISYVFSDDSIFNRANEAKFKTRWSTYKEQVDTYTTWKIAATMNNNSIQDINAGETLKELIAIEADVDIKEEDINTLMSEMVNNLEKQDERYAVVYHGELCYVLDDHNRNGERDAKWCLEIGIPVLELKRPSGVDNKKGDYEYVDGVYLNTPKIDIGFNKNYTRYVNEVDGVMQPGNWISEPPDKNWYSYSKGKWANLVTENEGIECYYTWIPRYCFKLNSSSQRADVKLIDINNNYKDPYTEEVTTWEELQKQGYQVPEAFTFDGKALPGYWAMKYNLGDSPTPSTIVFNKKVSGGVITMTNIQVNNATGIAKYKVFLNSNEEYVIDKPADVAKITTMEFELNNMRDGDNVINLTAYNAQGEMVGSYTDVYAKAEINPPDTTKFNQDTTFYVAYDENGNEHSTVPISELPPKGWYDYGESKWANIVARNNGGEVYYTWIPRYEFTLDGTNEQSIVKFIKGTSGGTGTNRAGVTAGYQVPEAFRFHDQELTGYWAMKYNVGDVDTTIFDAEAIASSSTAITVQGITGTGVASGQIYNYYISGTKRTEDTKPYKTTTNAADKITFEGLTGGVNYTILIEIRNSSGGYVGSITKQLKIRVPNKPALDGFNPDCTYYVMYDASGNETSNEKIRKNEDGSWYIPNGWYDYSQTKWANIVTTNGGTRTYFTWIPRYEFKLNSQTQRSDVRFLDDTAGATDGYQVPEAFTFNGKPLTGYWAMKYNVGG